MARGRLLESQTDLNALLASVRRVAVLGIKPESQSNAPAFYVPQALQEMGLEVIPVPVYEFGVSKILGVPICRRVQEVAAPVDLVDVFRRPQDLPPHLPDLIAAHPRAVWFQQGIRHEAVAEALLAVGIDVVQDRCLMVDYRRFSQSRG